MTQDEYSDLASDPSCKIPEDLLATIGPWSEIPSWMARQQFCNPAILAGWRVESGGQNMYENWFTDTGQGGIVEGVRDIVQDVFGIPDEMFQSPAGPIPGGIPQVTTGAQGSTASCWAPTTGMSSSQIARRYSRRRIKQVKVRDTSAMGWHWELREACAPRRMNVCNPRALGRAARRLGGFQQMASGVEKIIAHALRRKGSRGRGSPTTKKCFTRKRSC